MVNFIRNTGIGLYIKLLSKEEYFLFSSTNTKSIRKYFSNIFDKLFNYSLEIEQITFDNVFKDNKGIIRVLQYY
jgi:hypothetical protein